METLKKNVAHLNYPAKSTPEKATESLLRLLLPNEICLIYFLHNSTGEYCVWVT